MFKKKARPKPGIKFIDIEAGLEGNVKFSSPVNLRISGKFDGELETKGLLVIAENADIKAKVIKGEDIAIAGKVKGEIISTGQLELSGTAKVDGDIKAATLVVNAGAVLKGKCQVPLEAEKSSSKKKK